jgi:drug/metabolite transporter (DMT)-like permease
LGTGGTSITALVPTLLGLPITLLGVIARNEQHRVLALRGAIGLAALGLLGTLSGLSGIASALLLGGKETPALSMMLQAVMAIGCAVFVGLYAREIFSGRQVSR